MKTPLTEGVWPGQEVGGYRVDRKLGAGGFGQVYLAHRDGVAYALKFIHPASAGNWGWRELYILQRHEFPHVVRLVSHFKWPERLPEYLVLVMEYVPGPTLYQWAWQTNPSARQVVEKLCKLSQALGPMHAKEVLHRDLKGDNILMREPDNEPVLVDFGAGTMPDVPRATQDTLAPANVRYRSPESVAFFLRPDRPPGERYTYAITDELYALGVILYVLLTDQYPFDGHEYEILAEIVQSAPVPPSGRNARVPPALDGLCLRLLAKDPHARIPTTEALCVEFKKLLDEARDDPRWDLPLCYGWTQEGLSTEDAPEVGGTQPGPRMQRWLRYQPRRGPRPLNPAGKPTPLEPATPTRVEPYPTVSRWPLALVAALMGLAALGRLSVIEFLHHEPMRTPTLSVATSTREPLPSGPLDFSPSDPGPWARFVHEVAPPWKPREADSGAAPPRADIPAPVTPVALHTNAPRMKKTLGSQVLLAVTAAANVACPAAPVRQEPPHEARQLPPPQDCPPGAVETMNKLGLPVGENSGADMPGRNSHDIKPVPVREGPIVMTVNGHWHAPPYDPREGRKMGPIVFPDGTLLMGQLYIGDKRVYGRFTQATLPGGDTVPICMQLIDPFHHLVQGEPIESIEGTGVVKVIPAADVRTVDHFE